MLPGLDGTEVFFEPFIAALPEWIEPLVVTYPPRGPTGYDALLPRVERELAGRSACFLLAWSFGGPLALRAARVCPHSVRGVILCASFVRAPRPELVRWRFAAVAPVIGALRTVWRTRLLFPRFASPELRRAKARTWGLVDSAALAARTRALLTVDARADLAALRVPMLYVAFSRDRAVPAHNGAEILATARHAQFDVIPGHHLALFTEARRAAEVVTRFVSRHSRRAGSTAV